jgi:hypothetical protein
MRTPDIAAEQLVPTQADQVLSNAPMPHRATFFPLGFPIEIVSNSAAILEAASESWAMFRQRFDYPPLTLRLGVSADCDESAPLPPEPVCRIQQHLLSNIADPYNFVHCDLNAGVAFGWVTLQTAAATLYLRYHIIEAAILAMVGALRTTPLHAACVATYGHGMLLCGDYGAGKSSLAFAGARSGWTFTSDDASYLLIGRRDRLIVGNCHQFRLRDSGVQLFPELEGRPITPRATGKPSIVIPTVELPGLVTAESAIIRSIVFLNRQDVTEPELVVASRENAISWFSQSPFGGTTSFAEQRASIRHLLEVPIYELRYTDLDWAIERLNTLALTGN